LKRDWPREGARVELLPENATDADLILFIDHWAALLEREEYKTAFALTDQMGERGWTAELIREVAKNYGDGRPEQHVTVSGVPSDVSQRKRVDHSPPNCFGEIGEIWYDLNIEGGCLGLDRDVPYCPHGQRAIRAS
jgi:hypothetical protein